MKTILVPIDFSPVTRAVVDAAVALARGGGSRLVLLNVVHPPTLVTNLDAPVTEMYSLVESMRASAVAELARWRKKAERAGAASVRTAIAEGYPSVEVLREARRLKAGGIVIGSHGHTAFFDLLLGSTTSGVLRRAPCPVLVVPVRKR
jgi:nucleotide-binding universal stress UspA family protein